MELCCAARRFIDGSKTMPLKAENTVDESFCHEKVLRSLYLIRDNEKIPRVVEASLRDLSEFLDGVSNFDYVEDLVLKSAHKIILKSMDTLYSNANVQRHGSYILTKLIEGSEEIRSEFESLQVHKMVLRIMESHPQDFCIQAVGCSLVANMLRYSQKLYKDLIQENVMDLILQTMENFADEEELQIPACQLLSQLMLSCGVQEHEAFVRTGKFSMVMQIMRTHIDSGEVTLPVCQLFCTLASLEPACQALSERQVVKLVLNAMKKHSLLSDIQVAGSQFLCQLCKWQRLDGMLVMQGAREIALCALRQHRKNASVQAEALSLLKAITKAIVLEECEMIKSNHWLQDIYISMATHGDRPEIQKLGCECILQLIECFPGLCEVIGDPDICEDINRIPLHSSIMAAIMLHPDDLDVCRPACQSVSCIARYSDAIQDAFIGKGVHLSLQKLMQLHSDVAIIQQYCCNALRILCFGNNSRKELLITNNVFEEVSKCLFTFPENPQVQQEAIGLIACWSTDIPLVRHQCAAELIHLHILNTMRCFSSNILLLEMAFEALGALSAAEEIPQLLVDAGVCETILLIMQKHELVATIQQKACVVIQVLATLLSDKMCELAAKRITEAMCLHTDDERVQIEGCVALHVIAQIDAGRSEALVNSYAHDRLFHILQNFPPSSQVCGLASECLWFLGCVRDLRPRMLLSACASGLVGGAECLIRVGADVNAGEGYNTPLCYACMNNQEEMVKYLLTQVVTDVQNALRLCLEMEHHNLVGILLQHLGLDKEAGSLVWSGMNLGAVHPDWITPALVGDDYIVSRNQSHSRWSELLVKGKESWRRRSELSSSITSLSASLQDAESLFRVGSRPGQEAVISLESFRHNLDETIAEESNSSSASGDSNKLYDYELTDVFLPRADSKSGASFPYSPYDPRVVSPFFRSSKVLLPRSANWVSSDDKVSGTQLQDFSPDEGQSSFFNYTSRTSNASLSETEMDQKRKSWSFGERRSRQSSFSFDDAFYEVPDSDSESFTSLEETPRKSPRLANISSSPLSPPFQMPNNTFLCNIRSFPRKLGKRSRSCGVISDLGKSVLEGGSSENIVSKSRSESAPRSTPTNRKRKTSSCVNVPNAQVKHIDFSSNAIKDLQDLAKASHLLLLHLSNVEKLDLSHNNLKHFPLKLCEAMPRLRHVSLRHNELDEFPYHFLQNNHLSFLDLSHNNIDFLHRPQSRTYTSITLEHLDLSYNSLESFPEWLHEILPGLGSLSIAGNKLESLPSSSVHLCRLKALDISNNKLKEIPEAFLCECHCLERLNTSCNLLKSLPEKDATMFPKLWNVKVAQNSLIDKSPFFIPRFLLSLQKLQLLDISNNGLTNLPEPMAWQSTQLKDLNLSHNKIKKFPLKEGVGRFANLERLNLSHNNLRRIPVGIGDLTSLTSLNISHNSNITSFPDEMGKLSNLFELQRDGLRLDLEASILESKTKDLIGHLHSKLRNSVPYYRMKLVLVGMSGCGKTALRNVLIKEKPGNDGSVTVREWNLRDPKARCNHCNKKCVNYTISVWDFKGQEDVYCLFRSMLTTRALYVAVYDVTKGPEEIANLKPWLLNIQAFAPDAPVILVGTHHDKVPRERNDALLKSMKDTARKFCSNPGFPEIRGHIVLDAQHESPGVRMLKNKLKEVILRCKCVSHTLVGTQVPLNFVSLQEIFMEKAISRKNTGLPVLRKAEVQQLMKERDVLMDDAEVGQAARFLHEAGVIVHLDDPVMQLSDLYFVDPEWLCHLIAKLVAPRDSKHNPITDGIIQRSDVHSLVENDKGNLKLPTSMVPQFIRLLIRFGVMLPLSSNEFLIPTKLCPKFPSITLPGFGSDAIIKRHYEMAYIPIGFWPRLIARLLHFLKTMFSNKKHFSLLDSESIEKSRIQYGCEGIYANLSEDEFFCIVSSRITNKNSMIEITVPNSKHGYRILGHVVDHMDALLEEWFPGLCGVDPVHGLPLVKRLVPCIVCEGDHAHFFTLDECIQESAFDEFIICPKTAESIPIQCVAPDVVFGDMDEQFRIGDFDLVLDEIPENLLGNGAFGAVYRAKYRKSNEEKMDEDDVDDEDLITNPKKTVAVKVFHSAQDSTPHRILRQEMMFLHRLRHPSIISLVGACLRPSRALVLELAPLGSLSSQLKKEQLLSRGLQHRIAMQIAEGLAFLHKNKIVYRDLKPQNILIFSLSLGILVNAKIADYGIARYATLCGLTASEGTPGYRAPEVARGDIAYNKEADMYSYGMFLYELVTGGRKPFEDLRFRNEIDKAIVDGRALDPITSSGCPPWPDVSDLIAHLLESRPEKRPTAEEVYERLGTAELLCLRREVAVCKEQTVECMAVRRFLYKGSPKLELWMGSGLSCDNTAQVSWLNLTDRHTEGCQGTMLKDRRVKCMTAVHSDIVLVGTQSGRLWVFEAGHSMEDKSFHCLPKLPDAVLCLKHYVDSRSGLDLVLAGLANGHIAVYDAQNLKQPNLEPSLIDVRAAEVTAKSKKTGEVEQMTVEAKDSNGVQSKPSPVACMTVARRRLFCGSGNDVIVLQFNTDGKPEVERRWSVEDANRNLVLNIAVGSFVWVSTRDSTLVDTWEPAKGVYHGAVDCKTILERSGVTEASHDVRVLSLLLQQKKRQLWIGLGSGHVILINPSTKEPLRIIRRHLSAVRCMEACSGPAFGKPLSLVMTGGMGFIERPSGSQNKANADFGHVLIWEADVRAQIDFLDSYKKKREEYVSSSQHSARESSPGPRERSYTVDLIDNQCQSLFHLRRKSMI